MNDRLFFAPFRIGQSSKLLSDYICLLLNESLFVD